ncbi:MAG: hypothetical protein ABIH34_04400 [Nanoarchaeota archaeon]
MRTRNKVLSVFAAGFYFLNWWAIPLLFKIPDEDGMNMLLKEAFNPRMQVVLRTDDYFTQYSGTDEEIVKKYLMLSNLITNQSIELKVSSGDLIRNIEKGTGDCVETSTATYSNYLYMVNKAGRGDLSDRVRLALGEVQYLGVLGGGHEWLEYTDGDKWRVFEATYCKLDSAQGFEVDRVEQYFPAGLDFSRPMLRYCKEGYAGINDKDEVYYKVNIPGILTSRGWLDKLIKTFLIDKKESHPKPCPSSPKSSK